MNEFTDSIEDEGDDSKALIGAAKADKENKIFWDLMDELPIAMQVKITHMISSEDLKYFKGVIGVMLLGAIYSHKMQDELDDLSQKITALDKRLEDARFAVDTIDVKAESALNAVLSSFGKGVKDVMPKALGSVIVPAVVDQVNKRIDEKIKESMSWANREMLLNIGIALIVGMSLGILITMLAK